MKKTLTLVLLFCIFSGSIFAGGYQVRLQGNKQTGMGLVGTSLAHDASSIFYNPGALTMIKDKWSISAGFSSIYGSIKFQMKNSDYQAKTDNPIRNPLYLYASGKISDRLSAGVGVYTPYGSTAKWDENWAGKYLIQDISMMTIYVQPTLAYKITDNLSIGAGFVFVSGSVELNKAVPYSNPTVAGQATLEGSTTAYGANAGIYFSPTKKLHMGLNYRSYIKMKLEGGDAHFNLPTSVQPIIPAENKFDAELPLPGNIDFGITYDVTPKWKLSAEVNYVQWGVYDSLKFTFTEQPLLLNSSNPRLYSDQFIYRIGTEIDLSEDITFRCGGYYDATPTNEKYFNPETVSLDTYAFTLGLSLRPIKGLSIDVSYLQLETMKSEKSYDPAAFAGDYKVRTIIPGFGITYNF